MLIEGYKEIDRTREQPGDADTDIKQVIADMLEKWLMRLTKCLRQERDMDGFYDGLSKAVARAIIQTDFYKTKLPSSNVVKEYYNRQDSIVDLFNWTETIDKPVLSIKIRDRVERYLKVKCYYHFNSFIEVIMVGSESEIQMITYAKVREQLKSHIDLDYRFCTIDFTAIRSLHINCLLEIPQIITASICIYHSTFRSSRTILFIVKQFEV